MSESITLQCVRERGKFRIRFHSFTNSDGKVYTNVYNNSYNCQFPRDIRKEGRYYQVGSDDIVLVAGGSKQPFYRIRKNNLRILSRGPNEEDMEEAPEALVISKGKGAAGNKKRNSPSTEVPAPRTPAERPSQVFEVTECVICLSGPPDSIFLPCAHLCACMTCYQDMKKHSARPTCPLCRRTVLDCIPN